MIAHITSKEL